MIIIVLFSVVLLVSTLDTSRAKSYEIQTFTSQEQELDFNTYQSPYQINVKRVASTTPNQPNHCQGHPRRLLFNYDLEVFRLDTETKSVTYDQSVYMSITTLQDNQEIMEFQSIGNQFFVVTNNNKVYFLQESKATGKLEKKAETHLPAQTKQFVKDKSFFILVIDFAPFLIFPHVAVLCTETGCSSLQGWKPLQHITHANFMKIHDRRFILLSENQLGVSIYELTKDNKLENRQNYGKDFFNTTSGEVSMFDISPDPEGKSRIYCLDYNSGLYVLGFNESYPTVFTSFKKVLDQRNCFSMDLKSSDYIVMNCRVGKSDFLLEVYQDSTTRNYITQRPIFKYQTIFDVILTNKFYASRGYSGLKFYWVSSNYPYPLEFKKAGELFIANAIQIRHRNIQSKDQLYYATPNSIHKISITQKPSFATCLSNVPTEEQYGIEYKIPCQNEPESTCTIRQSIKFEVWKHSGISIMRTLVPTLLSFVGAIAILILLVMLYKKYQKEEDEVSLRYATSTHEFELESAR